MPQTNEGPEPKGQPLDTFTHGWPTALLAVFSMGVR